MRPPIWRFPGLNLHRGSTQHLFVLIQHFNVRFRRIELSPHKHYVVIVANVGLIFGLPTERCILQVTSTLIGYQFDTIRTCEEKLLNLHIGEKFCRAFMYYACATLLAPTSRLIGYQNLWHTIHKDGFRNDINKGQFMLN